MMPRLPGRRRKRRLLLKLPPRPRLLMLKLLLRLSLLRLKLNLLLLLSMTRTLNTMSSFRSDAEGTHKKEEGTPRTLELSPHVMN